ncbi:MAG: hypothetical protein U0892_16710 [Pirellulales bacterium]
MNPVEKKRCNMPTGPIHRPVTNAEQLADRRAQAKLVAELDGIIHNPKDNRAVDSDRRIHELLVKTQLSLQNCSEAKPCQVPRCLKCCDRLARSLRAGLAKQLEYALVANSCYLTFVTLTSKEWKSRDDYGFGFAIAACERLMSEIDSVRDVRGVWLAVDVVIDINSRTEEIPWYQREHYWHVHGFVVSDAERTVSSFFRDLPSKLNNSIKIETKIHWRPRNRDEVRQVIASEVGTGKSEILDNMGLKKLIFYADRRSTQRPSKDVAEHLVQQALIGSAPRSFSSGMLSKLHTSLYSFRQIQRLSVELTGIKLVEGFKSKLTFAKEMTLQHLDRISRGIRAPLEHPDEIMDAVYGPTINELPRNRCNAAAGIIDIIYCVLRNGSLDCDKALQSSNRLYRTLGMAKLLQEIRRTAELKELTTLNQYYPVLAPKELSKDGKFSINHHDWRLHYACEMTKQLTDSFVSPIAVQRASEQWSRERDSQTEKPPRGFQGRSTRFSR